MSYFEKIRRNEVLKFDFVGKLPYLRHIQNRPHCSPNLRNIIIHMIDVINKKEEYSTEALEKVKIQIIALENKIHKNDGKDAKIKAESQKYEIKTISSSKRTIKKNLIDSDGPEEISNCPDVFPRRVHYIRPVKSKEKSIQIQERRINNNDSLTTSVPFEDNQEKWFYNNDLPQRTSLIEDTMKSETIKNDLMKELQNKAALLNTNTDCTTETSNIIETPQTEPASIVESPEPTMSVAERKQNYLNRLKTVKIVKKPQTQTNDSIQHQSAHDTHSRDPRLMPKAVKKSQIDIAKTTLEPSIEVVQEALPQPIRKTAIQTETITKHTEVTPKDITKNKQESAVKTMEKPSSAQPQQGSVQKPSVTKIKKQPKKKKEVNRSENKFVSGITQSSHLQPKMKPQKSTNNPIIEPIDITKQRNSTNKNESNTNGSETNESPINMECEEELQVTLEIAREQRHRNEKRKRTKRFVTRRSKRLRALQVEIKLEQSEEQANVPVQTPIVETPIVETPIAETPVETPREETICDSPIEENNQNMIEIDQLKKEIIETNIPIVNLPIAENYEVDQSSENLLLEKKDDCLLENQFLSSSSNLFDEVTVKCEETNDIDMTDGVLESEINLSQELLIKEEPLNIKEEFVELSRAELELARIKIENLSFTHHNICFQFNCNICYFDTIDRPLFEEHLTTHKDLQWTGFCTVCDAHVIGHDASLIEEYKHMLKVHVKDADTILLDETPSVKPATVIKLRCLDGDHLSFKTN